MSRPYTMTDAANELIKFIRENAPLHLVRGGFDERHCQSWRIAAELGFSDRTYLNFEISFGVGVTLEIGLTEAPSLNWAGTHHSLAEAQACITLYSRVLDFACQFDCKRRDELGYVKQSDKRHGKKTDETASK